MSGSGGARPLEGRTVIVGVTGGIAAYKAVQLVRSLLADGATVDVIMTRGAGEFIGAVTFEGITGRPVRTEVWEDVSDGTHVALGRTADAIVVYPCTAHTIARLAAGLADDLLTTTALAHQGPLIIAPAMHTEMWSHPATAANVATLRSRGAILVGPVDGPLMGGDTGIGRAAEPEDVRSGLLDVLRDDPRAADPQGLHPDVPVTMSLTGRTVVVTAGGTREPIDRVRYVGNRSSGRMGFAIARAAAGHGAFVRLIAGPCDLPTPDGVQRIEVVSARDMDGAVREHEAGADVVIMAAAVADFRPERELEGKWSRTDGPPPITLVANPDVLGGVIERRGRAASPVVVGFAAQAGDLERSALKKLQRKGVEMLVANDVAAPGIGFEAAENAVLILHADGRRREVARTSKELVAEIILAELAGYLVPTHA